MSEELKKDFNNLDNGADFREPRPSEESELDTLETISEEKPNIQPIEIESYSDEVDNDFDDSNLFKSLRTFGHLDDLTNDPTMEFVRFTKKELQENVIEPIQLLKQEVALGLPDSITSFMETGTNSISTKPFHKNKWGFGNKAWDYYWESFYPINGNILTDGQLFIWINHQRIEFGFYIGECGTKVKNRFHKNFFENQKILNRLLSEDDNEIKAHYRDGDKSIGPVSSVANNQFISWNNWLKSCEKNDVYISKSYSKEYVLNASFDDLVDNIIETFHKLYPLILLAHHDDPMSAIFEYLYPSEKKNNLNSAYSLSQLAKDSHYDAETIEEWLRSIKRKKQAILYGPPGTGKTFLAKLMAKHLVSENDGFIDVVQFHSAYAYEDFIQGIRPRSTPEGNLEYPLIPGRFLEFCKKAKNSNGNCVLIIDEINRANPAQVFGELMYLLEYREEKAPLAGGGILKIPSNLHLIGTMNTADRSLALVDYALRRRFTFINIKPDYNILRKFHNEANINIEELITIIEEINEYIRDDNYFIGISNFLIENLEDEVSYIWKTEIEAYMEEIFFDQTDIIDEFRWDIVGKRLEDK